MSVTFEAPTTIESLLNPTEEELRAAAIDDLEQFNGDSPMIISNIDAPM